MHPLKALLPMEVTPAGITMLVSDLHSPKVPLPMEVTLAGITMLVSDVH